MHYEPSTENEQYYYNADTEVFTLVGGRYEPLKTAPVEGTTYYREHITFASTGNGNEAEMSTNYVEIHKNTITAAKKDETTGTYYIPMGTVHRFLERERTGKRFNETATLMYSNYPMVHTLDDVTHENSYHVDTFLGNNGKLTVYPAQGIKLSKEVTEVIPDTNLNFVFDLTLTAPTGSELAEEYAIVRVAVDGKETSGNVTVVFPNADAKIFLTATPEERARRRYVQYVEEGKSVPYEEVLRTVKERDARDEQRAAAPLKPAEDAILVDTTDLNEEESVELVIRLLKERLS